MQATRIWCPPRINALKISEAFVWSIFQPIEIAGQRIRFYFRQVKSGFSWYFLGILDIFGIWCQKRAMLEMRRAGYGPGRSPSSADHAVTSDNQQRSELSQGDPSQNPAAAILHAQVWDLLEKI